MFYLLSLIAAGITYFLTKDVMVAGVILLLGILLATFLGKALKLVFSLAAVLVLVVGGLYYFPESREVLVSGMDALANILPR